jgi:CRP/FNR family transcriptional regulator
LRTTTQPQAHRVIPVAAETSARDALYETCPSRFLCMLVEKGQGDPREVLPIEHKRLKAGERLISQIADHGICVVRFGTLKSFILEPRARERVLGFHFGGEAVGTYGFTLPGLQIGIEALEDSEICCVSREQVAAAGEEASQLHQRLWERMSADIVHAQELARLLSSASAESRLAGFLLDVAQRMKARGWSPHEFHLRMTRADIGSYLGLTIETISRTLSLFTQQGMIEVSRRHIRIVDAQALENCTP